MNKISEITSIFPVIDEMTKNLKGCKTLEQAAQKVTDTLYEKFSNSIVLARVFATMPFGALPDTNRTFVEKLAARQNISNLIRYETPVLTLLGTRGIKPSWNDRGQSEGHIGIPLASATFIDKIPMMSRLVKEIGINLDWIDHQDAIVVKTYIGVSGVFYVSDAETAIDDQKRKIIAAQDFVRDYQVKTVFGLGSSYLSNTTFLTLIIFCREQIEKNKVEQFLPLISNIKASTTSLVATKAIFAK